MHARSHPVLWQAGMSCRGSGVPSKLDTACCLPKWRSGGAAEACAAQGWPRPSATAAPRLATLSPTSRRPAGSLLAYARQGAPAQGPRGHCCDGRSGPPRAQVQCGLCQMCGHRSTHCPLAVLAHDRPAAAAAAQAGARAGKGPPPPPPPPWLQRVTPELQRLLAALRALGGAAAAAAPDAQASPPAARPLRFPTLTSSREGMLLRC